MYNGIGLTSYAKATLVAQADQVLGPRHIPINSTLDQFLIVSPGTTTAKIVQKSDYNVVASKQVPADVRNQFDIISKLFSQKISPRTLFSQSFNKSSIQTSLDFHATNLISEGQSCDLSKILPKEITKHIFTYLDPASYSCAVSVSKGWKEFESPKMWEYYCKQYRIHINHTISSWKERFVAGFQSHLYRQSKELEDAGYCFRLFESKYVVSGSVHTSAPILIGKSIYHSNSVLIGKSPNGRLLLMMMDFYHSIELLANLIYHQLKEIDNIPL